MVHSTKLIAALLMGASTVAHSNDPFTLMSNDIAQGEFMDKAQEYNGFGCSGDDLSPHLKWVNAPEDTKSFAITAYDPDAPTGSGWWHWQLVNIPKDTSELITGAASLKESAIPKGSMHVSNDYGAPSFGGACPPVGHGVHHYRFTVHALSVEKLALPEDASGALAGYMINANTIETSSIEALYKRD
ncbi:YbhB/YbcL family Raf kinase inhibitor-like protein [Paraglaciecola sp. 2405UD69-4]|uniref:YbhB/YbcL family Raf kinase inhibitor-like protein n=1 Tax=Paraglaciecola sp. 2405UD69-4 TaxID=3391836 RepID=UPI0039C9BFBF